MLRHLFFLTLLIQITVKSQILVGYYYSNYLGYPHDLIDYNCLTHIAHAFAVPDKNGNLIFEDWFLYPELIKSAHRHDKKIVLSIGGWGNSEGFKFIARDPGVRQRFINNLIIFIKENGYDGADIDWEYPSAEEKADFLNLISELREAFNISGIEILSAAIPAIDWHNVFDAEVLCNNLDWVGVMTYDFYGPWERTTGHNTALYSTTRQGLSVDYSIKHYLEKGFQPWKLCMGMEFVGYKFNSKGLYESHTGAKSIAYNKVMELPVDMWEYFWDDQAKVPYFFNPDSLKFVTIDNASSIDIKTDYIINNGLAGVIIWKLGLDYRNGSNELLNIAGDKLLSHQFEKPSLIYSSRNDSTNYKIYYFKNSVTGNRLIFIEFSDEELLINYYLENNSFVSIKLYNLLGEQLQEYTSALENEGEQNIKVKYKNSSYMSLILGDQIMGVNLNDLSGKRN
jgi:chitinase